MQIDCLDDRSLVRISGNDAEHFLENLVTCDVVNMSPGLARFGALLTPQGKILYDFFLVRTENTYLIDIQSLQAAEIAKRLMFYRLRAKVDISAAEESGISIHSAQPEARSGLVFQDPRHPEMGYRKYGPKLDDQSTGNYSNLRVSHNIPEGGKDFTYGDAYPHETLMDQFGGVDFKKGCYVGQEVVSRMQHRGTAKKRIIGISAEESLPATGTPILSDGKPAGQVGTVVGTSGLALLRLDRVKRANELVAGVVPISAGLPDWVSFSWPEGK
ncbi:MAG: folate-binding protein YgfZ [Pseudomonadota bacterium]